VARTARMSNADIAGALDELADLNELDEAVRL
jgi:hypothetical protein